MRVPSESALVYCLLGVALAFRVVYLVAYASGFPLYGAPLVDAKIYHDWARAIAGGDWLSRGEGAFYRAPLYPYLVAAVLKVANGAMPWLALLQQGLGLLTLWMSARLSRRIGGSRAMVWTLALLVFYGPLLPMETKILATSLGLFLHVAGLAAVASAASPDATATRRGAAGALVGLSTLVRPQWVLEILVFPLLFLREERGGWIRRWLPFWAAAALVIAPVTIRNLVIGHDRVLISSNGGMTLYQGNNPENRSGLLTIVKRFELFGSATQQRFLETRAAERELGRSLKPSETSRFFAREAMAFVVSDPLAWLRLEGMKLYRFVTGFEYADNYSFYAERERFWPLKIACVPFGLMLAAALLGIAGVRRPGVGSPSRSSVDPVASPKRARRLVLASAAFGLGGCLVFYVSSRYRMEAVPALAILGGVGLAGIRSQGAGVVRRVPLFLAAGLLLASFLPAGAPARSQESITWLQIGNAYENTKRPREAMAAYERAVDLLPENVFAWTNLVLLTLREQSVEAAYALYSRMESDVSGHPVALYLKGNLLGRMEKVEEARAAYLAAVDANPLFKEAHWNLALIEEKRGDYGAAAQHLEEARRLGDDSREALEHLAYARLQERRFAEARTLYRELLQNAPNEEGARFNLAVAEFYGGDLAASRELLGAFVRGHPDDELAQYYLGVVALRRGEAEVAVQALSRCRVIAPNNSRAAYYASLASCVRGRSDIDLSWLDRYGSAAASAAPAVLALCRSRAIAGWGEALDAEATRGLRVVGGLVPELARDLEGWIADETAVGGP